MAGIDVRRVVAFLAVLVALAVPAGAAAATPPLGHYTGDDGVAFHVRPTEHDYVAIEDTRYHAHSTFPRTISYAHKFNTCARVRTGPVNLAEYCIHGEFGDHDHAWGTVDIRRGIRFDGHEYFPSKPTETHHWRAALTG